MAIPAPSGRSRAFWLALAIVILAIPVAILNWPGDQADLGPPPPLTVAGAKGLDDNLLITCTSRDVLWQMIGPGKAPDAWRQTADPVRQVYVLATGGRALATCGLLDWCLQQRARGELPTLREIEAAYAAVGLPQTAKLVGTAAEVAEKRAAAIQECLNWDPAGGKPRPADPFVQVQGNLTRAMLTTDAVRQQAAYIRAHAGELLAPTAP